MTDPANAMQSFQEAHKRGLIRLQPSDTDPALFLHVDEPDGALRFTYVRLNGKTVTAFAEFASWQPINGVPCFAVGYAVPEAYRMQGRAKDVFRAALAELQRGLGRFGPFYIEAVVGIDNLPSQRIATQFISDTPVSITDELSGLPALQYTRRIDAKQTP